MEIRPIISALLRNKTGAVLIALQIAFTFAVVVNSAYIITTRVAHMSRPSGLDEMDIFSLRTQVFAPGLQFSSMVQDDMTWLNAQAGIVAASPVNSIPLSGGGWSSGLNPEGREEGDDAINIGSGIFWMNEHALESLGVELVAGRAFEPSDIIYFEDGQELLPTAAVMTEALAAEMWPDEEGGPNSYVGKRFLWGDDHYVTVVGIIERMHAAWVNWSGVERVTLMGAVLPGPGTRYIIRTEDGQRDQLMPVIEEGLAAREGGRVIESLRTLEEYKAGSYENHKAMAVIMAVVIVLLIAITAMGIVGLASFSVTQRTKQIGTRRALGARKANILSYFMTENGLVTTLGLAVGGAMAIGLNIWLVNEWELPSLEWLYLPTGVVFLIVLAQLATWQPARRASEIPPAVATRTV